MPEDVRRSEVADVKRMPVREFRDLGYLQEVNRRLLHPLGLAIEVVASTEPIRVLYLTEQAVASLLILVRRMRADPTQAAAMDALEQLIDDAQKLEPGDDMLSGIWDCRDDPEGIIFGDGVIDPAKAHAVTAELNLRSLARVATLGYLIQDVEPPQVAEV